MMQAHAADPGQLSPGGASHRMPAESAPHGRSWMQWPVRADLYGRSRLEAAQRDLAKLARAIAAFEPVCMIVQPDGRDQARRLCGAEVELVDGPADDMWARDSGPTFVIGPDGRLAVAGLNFNGWGGKQDARQDGQVAAAVARHLGLTLVDAGLVCEGGALEVDGDGTLLATESSIVNANRNPGLSRDRIEQLLGRALGVAKTIWIPGLRDLDITDAHIDALARFVAPGTVLIERTAREDGPWAPWAGLARQAAEICAAATDALGRRLRLETMRQPGTVRSASPDFVGSDANFYLCNGAVIAPRFGDEAADEQARDVLARLYPGRTVVQLDVDGICANGGGIHCVTQQQPGV